MAHGEGAVGQLSKSDKYTVYGIFVSPTYSYKSVYVYRQISSYVYY
jgi:hypothetical protein